MDIKNGKNNLPTYLYLILTIGLILRIGFIFTHQRPLISDEKDHHILAVNIIEKGSYSIGDTPTAYRPVGYPVLIAIIYLVFGQNPISVKIVQAILDCLTALILVYILKNTEKRIKILSAGLWILYIPSILYTNLLLSEIVFTFLLMLLVLLLTTNIIHSKYWAFILGILLGGITLIKPNIILLVCFFPFLLKKFMVPLKQLIPILIGIMIVISPWLFRNYFLFDTIALSSNVGINLLIGNHPHATGAYNTNFPKEIFNNASNEFEANSIAFKYATNFIIKNPTRFLINGIKKIGHLFSSEGGLLVMSFHPKPEDFSERYSKKYASLPFYQILIVNAPYFIILLLGIFGFALMEKEKFWYVSISIIFIYILSHFIFFGGSRFHFPLMPLFIMASTHLLIKPSKKLIEIPKLQLIITLFASLFCISIWIYEFLSIFNV